MPKINAFPNSVTLKTLNFVLVSRSKDIRAKTCKKMVIFGFEELRSQAIKEFGLLQTQYYHPWVSKADRSGHSGWQQYNDDDGIDSCLPFGHYFIVRLPGSDKWVKHLIIMHIICECGTSISHWTINVKNVQPNFAKMFRCGILLGSSPLNINIYVLVKPKLCRTIL